MTTSEDRDKVLERVFGGILEPLGFSHQKSRAWFRTTHSPIVEFLWLQLLKGAKLSPVWGMSTSYVPNTTSRGFSRPKSAKTMQPDLIIDPVDLSGDVSPHAVSHFPGKALAATNVIRCADHFIPLAMADFDRGSNVRGFCALFAERRALQYRRFPFAAYTRHRLASGFVRILTGESERGAAEIAAFCDAEDLPFNSPILQGCISRAEGDASQLVPRHGGPTSP